MNGDGLYNIAQGAIATEKFYKRFVVIVSLVIAMGICAAVHLFAPAEPLFFNVSTPGALAWVNALIAGAVSFVVSLTTFYIGFRYSEKNAEDAQKKSKIFAIFFGSLFLVAGFLGLHFFVSYTCELDDGVRVAVGRQYSPAGFDNIAAFKKDYGRDPVLYELIKKYGIENIYTAEDLQHMRIYCLCLILAVSICAGAAYGSLMGLHGRYGFMDVTGEIVCRT